MADKFANQSDSTNSPARDCFALVPSDSNVISPIPKGVYVGSGGDVTLRAVDSQADVTYRNLADGSYLSVRVLYIRATGTTASNMVVEA